MPCVWTYVHTAPPAQGLKTIYIYIVVEYLYISGAQKSTATSYILF